MRTNCNCTAKRFGTYDVVPNLKCLRTEAPIVDRLQQLAAEAKQIFREFAECEKSLSLSRGGKAAHMIFLLSSGLMRPFGAVVRIDVIEVCHHRHHPPMRGIVASQFIGD
ncbi:MAG: hypothetical protein R3B95_18635 [Nitrospirales bacterium]|nr:hypothetical protein [Nitrospirales bacterium]